MARVKSSHDMLAAVAELNARRIPMILGKMAKQAGGTLALSKAELDWLHVARSLHHRFSIGDYRHTANEAGKIHDLCQWLVDRHRVMRGASAGDPIPWDATAMESAATSAPPKGEYQKMIARIHSGKLDGTAVS